ncbi:MAG: hypothetical protein JWQ74_3701 [Marmoricola sp.]|nr:hypothetical protein [Marmoricola sp.]
MLVASTQPMLAEQHLDSLAFGWKRRGRLLESHVVDFSALGHVDQTLQACSEALVAMAASTQQAVQSRLQDPLMAAELFAIALHAMGQQDKALHDVCMGMLQTLPTLRDGYIGALEWANPRHAWWACMEWRQQPGRAGLAQLFLLTACAAHPSLHAHAKSCGVWRQLLDTLDDQAGPLGALMQNALARADPDALARAPALLEATTPVLRGLAAEALLRYPGRDQAHGDHAAAVLLAQVAEGRPDAHTAVYALASLRHRAYSEALSALEGQHGQHRLYLQALGWGGHLRAVPVLVEALRHPQHARTAGAALSMLTGSLPARDGWQADTDPSRQTARPAHLDTQDAQMPKPNPEADLPVPDKAGFERWWSAHRDRFAAPAYYLAGQPHTPSHLLDVLRHGRLAWRAMAARLLPPQAGALHLDTRAAASRQRQWLNTYSSGVKHHAPHT